MKVKTTPAPASAVKPASKSKFIRGLQTFIKHFKRDWQLHLLLMLPVIYKIIFSYGPMYGAQIAFRDFRPKTGITGSEWVGLKWFLKFLKDREFLEILSNTVILSLYSIIVGFSLAVFMALLLNTMRNKKFQRFTQMVSYMPHFISVVIIVAIFNQVFSPVNGLYGNLYRLFGGAEYYPPDFRATPEAFRHIYVWTGVWQNLGWDTIIYVAALSGVSPDLHEAAQLDGASRWKRVLNIDLPTILPTACIMLIMRCGSVMSVGFEKVYLLQSTLNLSTAEVIATLQYKTAMGSVRDFSYGTAIGLFNSAVNCTILIFVNWLSNTLSNREVSLF